MTDPESPQSLRQAMFTGAFWMVSTRWVIRGIGIVSTLILARILTPEDFGIIAVAMLFISLVEILVEFGTDSALIQRQDAERAHYDTAWTIRILQFVFVSIVVFICAPYTAIFFDEPRVELLIRVLAFGLLLQGFENIGVVAFRKEFRFHMEFVYHVSMRIGAFPVVIGLAFLLRNYWALAAGLLTTSLLTVVLSFALHPYRPRLTLSRFRDIWSFSQWMMVRSAGAYLRRKTGSFVVSKLFGVGDMGVYALASEIAHLPAGAIVFPISRALFPGYAKIADEPGRVASSYLRVLGVNIALLLPLGIGIALASEPLVTVALGSQWDMVPPVLAWLSIFSTISTLSFGVQPVLMAIGHIRRVAGLVWFQALVATPLVVVGALNFGPVGAAQGLVISSLVTLPVFVFSLTSVSRVTAMGILGQAWRPMIACVVMAAVLLVESESIEVGPIGELTTLITTGFVTYLATLFALWRLSGKPEGVESLAVDLIGSRLRKIRSPFGLYSQKPIDDSAPVND